MDPWGNFEHKVGTALCEMIFRGYKAPSTLSIAKILAGVFYVNLASIDKKFEPFQQGWPIWIKLMIIIDFNQTLIRDSSLFLINNFSNLLEKCRWKVMCLRQYAKWHGKRKKYGQNNFKILFSGEGKSHVYNQNPDFVFKTIFSNPAHK